jgi:hypothetical protein
MPIRIADEEVHRFLKYVAAVTGQGYRLIKDEAEAFIAASNRRQVGGLAQVVGESLTRSMLAISGRIESTAEWLQRLGWVSIRGDEIKISDLGQAVLRHLEQEEIEATGPIDVLLEPQNPISYAETIRRIAHHEDALLIDPYFKLDQLMDVVHYTSVTRVLSSVKLKKPEIAGLAKAMDSITVGRAFGSGSV